MDHQEMIDQVSDEVRNVSIDDKITRWLNMSIVETGSKFVFGHLHRHGTTNTIAANPDVTLASDIHWLKGMVIAVNNSPIYPIDEGELVETYPLYRTTQGVVDRYYLNGNIAGLWRVPSSIQAITYPYQAKPIKLSALTDTSDLPEEWHLYVVQKATTKAYNYEGNDSGYTKSIAEEKKLLISLQSNVYRRPDQPLVLGGTTYRSRPSRPKFPAHYPQPR